MICKDPKLPMAKRKVYQQRWAFLYESLFIIEFFNGKFIKNYENFSEIEDLP
jgi:hypothetical protein